MSGMNMVAYADNEFCQGFNELSVPPLTGISELTAIELELIVGAVNGVQVAEGVALIATGVIAVASAPVTVPLVAGACVVAACGGFIAGHGLAV